MRSGYYGNGRDRWSSVVMVQHKSAGGCRTRFVRVNGLGRIAVGAVGGWLRFRSQDHRISESNSPLFSMGRAGVLGPLSC